jgi:hypothetical protein
MFDLIVLFLLDNLPQPTYLMLKLTQSFLCALILVVLMTILLILVTVLNTALAMASFISTSLLAPILVVIVEGIYHYQISCFFL